ncbi:FAD-binding protein [Nesterenkonia pannonica]|uniref:FAD-binding protein n=1 Tax=Nesterenkonia pannonica TaxID=1548602 RepID=UPI00216402AA|nr:FAD-binding protein [Nesterenkonia pannonica]
MKAADYESRTARVLPGTGLRDLGAMLGEHDLAMMNLGDVDYQAIAGALSTGTHGSGISLGNLSSMVIGGVLVNGLGRRSRSASTPVKARTMTSAVPRRSAWGRWESSLPSPCGSSPPTCCTDRTS